jgi:hypothetical protein
LNANALHNGIHADVRRQLVAGEHHSSARLVRGRQAERYAQLFLDVDDQFARSSFCRIRAMSRFGCLIWRAAASGFGPRFFGAMAAPSAAANYLRQLPSIEE